MGSNEPASSSGRGSNEASTSSDTNSKESTINFQQTYDAVKDKKLVVEKITIVGLDRTKAYIVSRELEPVRDAKSLDEIKDVLMEAHEHLQSLGVFDGVELIITDSETVRLPACASEESSVVSCHTVSHSSMHACTPLEALFE